jgi:hypothetical protein
MSAPVNVHGFFINTLSHKCIVFNFTFPRIADNCLISQPGRLKALSRATQNTDVVPV